MKNSYFIINGSFVGKKVTGTQRYATEISRLLIQLEPKVKILIATGVTLPDWLPEDKTLKIPCLKKTNRLSLFFTYWIIAPFYIDALLTDDYVVWSPSNVGSIFFKNHIVTIHDMAVRAGPDWFSPLFVWFYRFCFSWFSSFPYRFTTVSKFSKHEIIKYYSISPSRIQVVYNGVDSPKPYSLLNKFRFQNKKYVLSVASLDPRKNTKLLLAAWKLMPEHIRHNYFLLLVGSNAPTFRSYDLILSKEEVIHLGYVKDHELEELYFNAHLVILASLYEGFGLPIVEALIRGVPVLCSDIPSFKEIGGKDVIYFQSNDEIDLNRKLENLLRIKRMEVNSDFAKLTWAEISRSILNIGSYKAIPSI